MKTTKNSILNYETVALLRKKVLYGKATVTDFEIIEDLLEAFGKPRNLVLKEMYKHRIFSYQEYLEEYKKPVRERSSNHAFGPIMGTTGAYLTLMARYFIKKENIKPEVWELKDPETV